MGRLLTILGLAIALSGGFWGLPTVGSAQAQETTDSSANPSGQPVPRFVTIDRSEVNMRQGPSTAHRKLWVYVGQVGLPVEVVAETELWRQIRDPEGDLGWVHHALLSEDRGAVVVGSMRALRRQPSADAQTVAYMEPRVVAAVNECSADWCQLTVEGHTGWVRHSDIWGVYPGEVVQ